MLGQDVVDEIVARRNLTYKWYAGELEEIAAHYRALNNANPLTKKDTQ